jgi:cell division protein FtsA
VKYLSEIITARVEEIIMAMLYEINESGFADMLRSGIVVTGGCAQIANLGNFIYELSGYRVRTGYPQGRVSIAGCDGLKETTAATSVGLILAAKEEQSVNCAIMEAGTRPCSVTIETEEEQPEPVIETITETESGELFKKEDIETVEKPKKEKEKRVRIFDILWSNAKKKAKETAEKTGRLLDEISEEEI